MLICLFKWWCPASASRHVSRTSWLVQKHLLLHSCFFRRSFICPEPPTWTNMKPTGVEGTSNSTPRGSTPHPGIKPRTFWFRGSSSNLSGPDFEDHYLCKDLDSTLFFFSVWKQLIIYWDHVNRSPEPPLTSWGPVWTWQRIKIPCYPRCWPSAERWASYRGLLTLNAAAVEPQGRDAVRGPLDVEDALVVPLSGLRLRQVLGQQGDRPHDSSRNVDLGGGQDLRTLLQIKNRIHCGLNILQPTKTLKINPDPWSPEGGNLRPCHDINPPAWTRLEVRRNVHLCSKWFKRNRRFAPH